MKIVFLGSFVSPGELQKLPSASVAGNKMQYNLLKYLSKKDVNLTIYSFKVHAKFPKERKILCFPSKEVMLDEFEVNFLPYINLPLLKEISLILAYWFALFKTVKKDSIIFSYNLFVYQSFALNCFRKKVNGKCACLLADLSAGEDKKGLVGRFFRWAFDSYHNYSLKKCEYYIALNEYAVKTRTKSKRYIIMDGGIEPSEYIDGEGWNGQEKNVLYTGALVDYSGIMTLVKAMQYVTDERIFLDIYGNGPLAEKLQNISKTNKKIRFHGTVSNSKILEIQRKSWLLANPRPVENDTAKVTFPSKIFEYMMSGRPVMSTRLNGFSNEYDDLIYWIDDCSVMGFSSLINELATMDDSVMAQKAASARSFMMKYKTWKNNADKVYDFLKDFERTLS